MILYLFFKKINILFKIVIHGVGIGDNGGNALLAKAFAAIGPLNIFHMAAHRTLPGKFISRFPVNQALLQQCFDSFFRYRPIVRVSKLLFEIRKVRDLKISFLFGTLYMPL